MPMEVFQRKLQDVRRAIDNDGYRQRVLMLCEQTEPKSFDEYSSSGSFRRLEKFESSTYSEVLKAVDMANNNKPVVMKIMRALSRGVLKMLPSLSGKGCQSYHDILNELVVTQALSQLHEGILLNGSPDALYKTHFFCLIHEIKVVSGSMEKTLSKSKVATEKQKQPKQIEPNDKHADDKPKNAEHSEHPSDVSNVSSDMETSGIGPSFAEAKRQFELQVRPDQVKQDKVGAAADAANGQIMSENDQKISTKQTSTEEDRDSQKQVKELKSPQNKKPKGTQNEDEEIENERMLIAALPHEYVVSVMRHDGQPLWWWMTHKKINAQQLGSVLVQVIVGLAIAEHVYLYEHRDLHVSNILIKKTSDEKIPFVLNGSRCQIESQGIKATIIDATFSRLTHNGKVYYRDLTSTLRAYGARKTPPRMSLQNRSYRQMVRLTRNNWFEYTPKTNLIWLTYLCETMMKYDAMKKDADLVSEVKKIRDHTLKVKTTLELLECFPIARAKKNKQTNNK